LEGPAKEGDVGALAEFEAKEQGSSMSSTATAMPTMTSSSSVVPQAKGVWPPGLDPKTVGRNDECPCGSGKKFKKCHGA
jgi:uncharacterized protein YecA (UPF0149 family)